MKDAIVMWREPKMVVLSAVCAAIYVAALLPFKFLVIFPGLAEVRPAAALPIVFSFLFGPAGAWGSAFGNLIGDVLGGMFGPGSFFGFIANFSYGYIPYKLWRALMGGKLVSDEIGEWKDRLPARFLAFMREKSWTVVKRDLLYAAPAAVVAGLLLQIFKVVDFTAAAPSGIDGTSAIIVRYLSITFHFAVFLAFMAAISILLFLSLFSVFVLWYSPKRILLTIMASCLACGGLLGWGVDLLGFFPFRVFGVWIFANNLVTSVLVAPPLLLLMHPRVQARSLMYSDLLPAAPRPTIVNKIGALVLGAGLILLFAVGLGSGPGQWAAVLMGAESGLSGAHFSPFAGLVLLGILML